MHTGEGSWTRAAEPAAGENTGGGSKAVPAAVLASPGIAPWGNTGGGSTEVAAAVATAAAKAAVAVAKGAEAEEIAT